ncbi:MAG: hypothetical protein ACOY90_16920 [Candidatus Zhuqueibacterota bacterium]
MTFTRAPIDATRSLVWSVQPRSPSTSAFDFTIQPPPNFKALFTLPSELALPFASEMAGDNGFCSLVFYG